jgi:hypothetical protein
MQVPELLTINVPTDKRHEIKTATKNYKHTRTTKTQKLRATKRTISHEKTKVSNISMVPYNLHQ